MREHTIRATYYLESEIELEQAAAAMAGEQSSGTFVAVPGESPELHQRHGAGDRGATRRRPRAVSALADAPDQVHAGVVTVDFPMENVGTDLATLQTALAGNLFELDSSSPAGCRTSSCLTSSWQRTRVRPSGSRARGD